MRDFFLYPPYIKSLLQRRLVLEFEVLENYEKAVRGKILLCLVFAFLEVKHQTC